MKKKLIFLLILFVSIMFTSSVYATSCSYGVVYGAHKKNGATELDDWKSGSYVYCDSGTCQELKVAAFSLPSNYSPTGPNVTFNFNMEKDNKVTKRSYKSYSIENWSKPFANIQTSGQTYTKENVCPPYLVLRTGVYTGDMLVNTKTASAYIAENADQAKSMVTYGVSNNTWKNQSLIYILKAYESSKESDGSGSETEKAPIYTSCADFTSRDASKLSEGCLSNSYYSCMWVKKGKVEYCNYDNLTYIKCGDSRDLPDRLPGIISFLVNFIKIVTPLILVFVSILSLVKATAASKEDEMKKAQSTLVRRIIAAALVFFVIQITQFVVSKVADDDDVGNISSCLSCMLNNDCSKNRYFKTMVGGEYQCTYLNNTGKHYDCENDNLLSDDSILTDF